MPYTSRAIARDVRTLVFPEENVLRGRDWLFSEPTPQAVGIGSTSGTRKSVNAGAREVNLR